MRRTSLPPTPYPALNTVLQMLLARVQHILADKFIAAYLQGSFATGDFDEHSDVDFLIVTRTHPSATQLAALQTMHQEIFDGESHWAKHLEGSYIPADILRGHEAELAEQLWYLDHGSRILIQSDHDNTVVVRWILHECGIVLEGPAPQTLIDPISTERLRREVLETMQNWGAELFAEPERMNSLWYQSFAVISYCRMLHTLSMGAVLSKPAAVRWAKEELDPQWADLIQRAWEERPHPEIKVQHPADLVALSRTIAFMKYALSLSRQ